MLHTGLMVASTKADISGERTFERRNPVSGEVVTVAVAACTRAAVCAAEAAAAAFVAWSTRGPNARREVLCRAADLMLAAKDEFVDRMMAETGATAGWAHFNVQAAATILREAAAMTTQVAGEVIPSDRPNTLALAMRRPAGVVLGIAPWNAPIILGVRAVAMPLACGNTVVLKASEVCPSTHALIGEILIEAGVPEGAVNVITTTAEDAGAVVNALIDHPAIRRINFTGSTRVGRLVAERAARWLKPVLLELGGKAPLVVLDDADLEAAVDATIFGAFMNQGQICMSTERVIVDDAVAEDFTDRLAARARGLTVGNPKDANATLGALIGANSVSHAHALIDDALEQGATLAAGTLPSGVLMPAAVVSGVTPEMRLYREESFAPIVAVVRAKGPEAAIAAANDCEYGLAAAVFGSDIGRTMKVAMQIRSGICHVNGPTVHDEPQMPFGGIGSSGYGRFGGKAGVAEFTDLQWLTIATGPQHYPF